MEGERDYDYFFKLLIVGDYGVGKSCLSTRFLDQSFKEIYQSTIGIDVNSRTLNLGGTLVKLQIFDTPGQSRFRNIATSYFNKADGFMIVFDKTDSSSFESTEMWMYEVDRHAKKSTIKMLVGSKSDLYDHEQVTKEEAKGKAMSYGIPYIETSAKSSLYVDEAFETIIRELIKQRKEFGTPLVSQPAPKISLTTENRNPTSQKCFL
ncbi:unnamed protein product [Blepharisma stoltei]|uniref:Uncharacterized protein n=1 Tax=Blepharisma stoltei TaxID=1481888 RepID=A0AAU9IJR7_9CILI|nr:unnamed protein product [Blepharisma stoltei]